MAKVIALDDITERLARRLSDNVLVAGDGESGSLTLALAKRATRTFRAHWTGFKVFYPDRVIVAHAVTKDGKFWSEGYFSPSRPSWVLTFRDKPHSIRGSGGPRPDDQTAAPQYVESSLNRRKALIEAGVVTSEELIRMEDFDDPLAAVDGFFNYSYLYVLKAAKVDWSGFGYKIDPSLEWDIEEKSIAALPFEEAVETSLKRSDIIWVSPDTAPDQSIPCWFLYTKEGRLFVLSGERQQAIPGADRVRSVRVVTRWKGRDARMSGFDAAVRLIRPSQGDEFAEISEKLIAKRQSVRESTTQTLDTWMRECVILELTPRR